MTSPLTYVARHLQALLGALGHLLRQPLGTLLSIAVISLALTLPACLYLLVKNARAATGSITEAIELTVYLKTDVSLERARQLADSARARREAGRVTLISADEGLAEFRKYSGFGAALEALQGNPLPHVISLRPRSDRADPSSIASLQRYLGSWPEADIVQVDNEWVRRLSALLGLLERVFQVFAALLAFGVLAIIGNAIRLEISARRAEIEVTKLVGGSNAYVRRPFLYLGGLYGLLGAALAALWLIALAAARALAAATRPPLWQRLPTRRSDHRGARGAARGWNPAGSARRMDRRRTASVPNRAEAVIPSAFLNH